MASITLTTTSTLNAGSITITVFEDVGGDGSGVGTDALGNNYDNSATVTLAGGAGETNTLTGFNAGGGNDYWWHAEFDVTNPTDDAPTLDSVEIDS